MSRTYIATDPVSQTYIEGCRCVCGEEVHFEPLMKQYSSSQLSKPGENINTKTIPGGDE